MLPSLHLIDTIITVITESFALPAVSYGNATKMTTVIDAPVREFIEAMGIIAESDGLTRIAGRIWGLLVATGATLSQIEIAEAVKVSRASVSANIRSLEALDLVEIQTRPGDRNAYYAMRENAYSSLAKSVSLRCEKNNLVVDKLLSAIDEPKARHRLEDLQTFYRENGQAHLDLFDWLCKLARPHSLYIAATRNG